ncbi:hypothetical protein EVAR_74863_1 [Eumeta japonica]|uniref:Uncharacterized protein n=1 Tax=Eumeta variegata TaxID=151549 RepID=A0A4C1SPQ5_EUMVA|nr:hypothetical protein EVAR_74863_1 [Eumeta japonica]
MKLRENRNRNAIVRVESESRAELGSDLRAGPETQSIARPGSKWKEGLYLQRNGNREQDKIGIECVFVLGVERRDRDGDHISIQVDYDYFPALNSDLGTAPYSNSGLALDSDFSPAFDSDFDSVRDSDPDFRFCFSLTVWNLKPCTLDQCRLVRSIVTKATITIVTDSLKRVFRGRACASLWLKLTAHWSIRSWSESNLIPFAFLRRKRAYEPPNNRRSSSPMDTCNSRGFTGALPAF